MGENCDKNGLPGDKTRYRPPNELDDDVLEQLGKNAADYFGNVAVHFALPAFPSGQKLDQELNDLLNYKTALRPQLEQDIRKEKNQFYDVFERALGIEIVANEDKHLTLRLLAGLASVTNFWVVREKCKFNRPRPVQLLPEIDPLFCPGHAAYPSAHSCTAHAFAEALIEATDAFPHLHAAIGKAANDIAFHREVAGVHYRSDSECGELFATQLMDALRRDNSKIYAGALQTVRAELTALLQQK